MVHCHEADESGRFLEALLNLLPARFYGEFSIGLIPSLSPLADLEMTGPALTMHLSRLTGLIPFRAGRSLVIGDEQLGDIKKFLERASPRTFLNPRTLASRRWRGVYNGPELISVAGLHVYSPVQSVAALGSVATDPAFRCRGLAAETCAMLCQDLLADGIKTIGLDVSAENHAAIALYAQLGFERGPGFRWGLFEKRL